jgi:E3 ubiquitin-protein ligase BRE1
MCRDSEGQISALSAENPSEASARAELEKAQRALAKFERILGPDPAAAEDAVRLAKQLEAADTEISTLRLKLDTAEAVSLARDSGLHWS